MLNKIKLDGLNPSDLSVILLKLDILKKLNGDDSLIAALSEQDFVKLWHSSNQKIIELLIKSKLLSLESLLNTEGRETKTFTFYNEMEKVVYRYMLRSNIAYIDMNGIAHYEFYIGLTHGKSFGELKDTGNVIFQRAELDKWG